MRRLLIIGASGHGKVVADIAKNNGYEEIAFLDDNTDIVQCGDYPVIGTSKDIVEYIDSDFFVAIGNAEIRQRIYMELNEQGVEPVTLIHPSAVIGENVCIGAGTVVMAGTVVNPDANLGIGCIINTCSSVDHDCKLADFVHVAVGGRLAGNVLIGERTWIGAGATVINNVTICADCVIGAGAVVVKDIQESGIYIGVPARRKQEKRTKNDEEVFLCKIL